MALKIRIYQQWPIDGGPDQSTYSLFVDSVDDAGQIDYDAALCVSIYAYSVPRLVEKYGLIAGPAKVTEIAVPCNYIIYKAA